MEVASLDQAWLAILFPHPPETRTLCVYDMRWPPRSRDAMAGGSARGRPREVTGPPARVPEGGGAAGLFLSGVAAGSPPAERDGLAAAGPQ